MRLCRRLLVLLAIAAAACSNLPAGPSPRAISPTTGPSAHSTAVTITGERFYVVATASLDDPSGWQVDRGFKILLGDHALDAVAYVGVGELSAVVPAGLPAGLYDLHVVDPRGRRGTLAGAFSVLGLHDGGVDAQDGGLDGSIDAPAPDVGPDGPKPDLGPKPDGPVPDTLKPDTLKPDTLKLDAFSPPGGTVTALAVDPFGDGTAFSFVFGYKGLVYLGPKQDGTGAVRMQPDGSSPTPVTFSFPADVNGNKTDNGSAPPYTSLGTTGCTKDTPACGPDNEDGWGLFASGQLGGQEWLVVGGSISGKGFDYVYLTNDSDTQLDFRFFDISDQTGGGTAALSTMQVLGGRVYLGLPDDGGAKPYLVTLLKPPSAPGVDAVSNLDAINLKGDKLPGGLGGKRLIDALGSLQNLLYVFNEGGCAQSTIATPLDAEKNPTHWTSCTPTATAYTGKSSPTATTWMNLTPRDKTFAQVATYKGRLYAARNTTTGPQLWACDPAATGVSTACDPGDWSLIAANSSGDQQLSQFDNAANTSITLLVATAQHLYVGYDSGSGVVVFRTAAATPTQRSDFEGLSGCSAANHPASCVGLGGAGFGTAGVTRLLSNVALNFGGRDYVYVVAGDGSTAARVYRIAD